MQVNRTHYVEDNASVTLTLGNQIFLVNAFALKPLDIAASNVAGE